MEDLGGWGVTDEKGRPRTHFGICTECGERKSWREFSFGRTFDRGHHNNRCKVCDNSRDRDRTATAQPGEPLWVGRLEAKLDRLLEEWNT